MLAINACNPQSTPPYLGYSFSRVPSSFSQHTMVQLLFEHSFLPDGHEDSLNAHRWHLLEAPKCDNYFPHGSTALRSQTHVHTVIGHIHACRLHNLFATAGSRSENRGEDYPGSYFCHGLDYAHPPCYNVGNNALTYNKSASSRMIKVDSADISD
ncbi:hypothetical protein jhhlp_005140 [Lomentospora prolificans]|uniref:Uncharacterized protein n=1 Tax=Lomentospora prolificans TaxID=41688 RepID=A0A2N3N7K5_9PEZI|nr:hypothetical protein jhhlp_005140 [Lomentospora prolificans]